MTFQDKFYHMFNSFFKENKDFLKSEFKHYKPKDLLENIDLKDIFEKRSFIKTLSEGTNLYHATSIRDKTINMDSFFELKGRINTITSFSESENLYNSNREYFLQPYINNFGRILVFTTKKELNIVEIDEELEGRKNFYIEITNKILTFYDNILEEWRCPSILKFCGGKSIIIDHHVLGYFILYYFSNDFSVDGISVTDYFYSDKNELVTVKEIQTYKSGKFPMSLRGVYINEIYFTSLIEYNRYLEKMIRVANTLAHTDIKIFRRPYLSSIIRKEVENRSKKKIMIRNVFSGDLLE